MTTWTEQMLEMQKQIESPFSFQIADFTTGFKATMMPSPCPVPLS